MVGRIKLLAGLAVVVGSMLVLFSIPRVYFVAATFLSTSCMLVSSFLVVPPRTRPKLKLVALAAGLSSAVLLYLVFFAGALALKALIPSYSAASESSIYSLVASPSNPLPLQVGVLLFDAAGYESFFRGVLQKQLQPKMGVASAPTIALFDAMMHLATFNLIWVATTFVADLIWGLTYHFGRGFQASFTSHFIWDLAIFVIRPVL
ncbi:MAG TPA: CPBP family glutamic-type intramembrane protease [Nitrososphaerales archaeon]|nr:CPBP family glutamic-type intramembrane protease [Nitrososphaerales archaeon]